MKTNIDIIGAGIGGLTLGITLQRAGIPVQIYEQSEELKPVGAGIILAINAMQIYDQLGLRPQLEKAANKISSLKITNPQLETLSVTDLRDSEKKYGVHSLAIHRGELQKILADEVGRDRIHLSKRLSRIESEDNFRLTFSDETTLESELVIGADGIKSVVRNELFPPSKIRNADQICWRGICPIDIPKKYNHELNEAWGPGRRFGFVKIGENKVYWYALVNSQDKSLREKPLEDIFKNFHKDILRIISETSSDQIIKADILDLDPIPSWHQPNAALLGDAAHAMTPNLGQGACQAIEDTHVIGQLLHSGLTISDMFATYEKLRKRKAVKLVQDSWQFGKLAQWNNPLAIGIRNTILKLSPDFIQRRRLEELFKLEKLPLA